MWKVAGGCKSSKAIGEFGVIGEVFEASRTMFVDEKGHGVLVWCSSGTDTFFYGTTSGEKLGDAFSRQVRSSHRNILNRYRPADRGIARHADHFIVGQAMIVLEPILRNAVNKIWRHRDQSLEI
nr:hypothetical protein CFP56_00170 [Quercus suber]